MKKTMAEHGPAQDLSEMVATLDLEKLNGEPGRTREAVEQGEKELEVRIDGEVVFGAYPDHDQVMVLMDTPTLQVIESFLVQQLEYVRDLVQVRE